MSEFDESLRRVEKNLDLENPRPKLDPQVRKDVVDAFVQGREIEDYRQALEHFGFSYFPPHHLPPWDDGRKRTEGEWRNAKMRSAFTSDEVVSMFRSPEDFAKWAEKTLFRMRAAQSGLLIP